MKLKGIESWGSKARIAALNPMLRVKPYHRLCGLSKASATNEQCPLFNTGAGSGGPISAIPPRIRPGRGSRPFSYPRKVGEKYLRAPSPPRAVEKGAFCREVRNTLMCLCAGTSFNAPEAALRRPSPAFVRRCAAARRRFGGTFGEAPAVFLFGAFAPRGDGGGPFRSAGESLADPILVTRQRNPYALRGSPLHHPVRIFTPSGWKNGAGTKILTFSCADRGVFGLWPGVDAGGWGQRKVGRR